MLSFGLFQVSSKSDCETVCHTKHPYSKMGLTMETYSRIRFLVDILAIPLTPRITCSARLAFFSVIPTWIDHT